MQKTEEYFQSTETVLITLIVRFYITFMTRFDLTFEYFFGYFTIRNMPLVFPDTNLFSTFSAALPRD